MVAGIAQCLGHLVVPRGPTAEFHRHGTSPYGSAHIAEAGTANSLLNLSKWANARPWQLSSLRETSPPPPSLSGPWRACLAPSLSGAWRASRAAFPGAAPPAPSPGAAPPAPSPGA